MLIAAAPAAADSLRVVTYHADLSRDGPGLLLRDIQRGEDQAEAAARTIAALRPDILLLSEFDWDAQGAALTAFADRLTDLGLSLPHHFAPPGNAGLPAAVDLDGDGTPGGSRDTQGFGRFRGDGSLALLARWPIDAALARDFSEVLWRDLPEPSGVDVLPASALAAQRLSSTSHWAVPVSHPDGDIWILAFRATPPVFDGPEDRNGLRNAAEITFWRHFLDGTFGAVPQAPMILMGNANLDPTRGEGRRGAIRALLNDARLQDPRPDSPGGQGHNAPYATADWNLPTPGKLRVSYILPSTDWRIRASGVHWPAPDDPAGDLVRAAGRHRPVWADLVLPD